MQRKLLGVDHPDVALALNNLAFLAHDKGDLKTAAKMSRDSLEMYRRTLGEEHPSVAQGMNTLAMWLIEDGEFAPAEPLVRAGLEMRRKLLGPEHADVATSMTLLAGLLIDTGRYDEALQLAHGRQGYLVQGAGARSTGARPAPSRRRERRWPGSDSPTLRSSCCSRATPLFSKIKARTHLCREFQPLAGEALPDYGPAGKGARTASASTADSGSRKAT